MSKSAYARVRMVCARAWRLLNVLFFNVIFPVAISDRMQKKHTILINTECVRGPRVQTLLGHLFNRDSRPDEFQPYMAWKRYYTINLFDQIQIILCPYINLQEIKPYTHFCHQWLWNPIGNFLNPTYTIFKFIALHHFVCSIFLIRLKETFDKCKTQVEEA